MSDFREHARNHLRTAAGTYIWVGKLRRVDAGDIRGEVIRQALSGKRVNPTAVTFSNGMITDWALAHIQSERFVLSGHFTTRLLLDDFQTDTYSTRFKTLFVKMLSDNPLPEQRLSCRADGIFSDQDQGD